MVDVSCYHKSVALCDAPLLGRILFYTGTIQLYLDRQVWLLHYRWWHPFTWLMLIATLAWFGLRNAKEVCAEMFLPRSKRLYSYTNAPK